MTSRSDIPPIADMTLRDYFAAQALAGGLEQGVENELGAEFKSDHLWWHSPEKIAQRAYAIADAMMKHRVRDA